MSYIHSFRVISSCANCMDENSLEYYRGKPDPFEKIDGYFSFIDEDDINNEDLFFMSGEKVSHEHLNEKVFYVTDGHHRVTVGIERGINIYTTS